jgi:glyoxylate reductase
LILAVPRRLSEGANVLGDGKPWAGWSPTWMLGRRIWGKRLGIVGMGRIGTAVARRAKAFGLSIHYHNRHAWLSRHRGRAGGDLLGKPRPDAGPHGHHLGQLPFDAGDLPSAFGRRLALMQPTAPIS